MSKVHEQLSPETYGITILPIIVEECCTHDDAYQVELYDGPKIVSIDWYCEECGEYLDPKDYRGEE